MTKTPIQISIIDKDIPALIDEFISLTDKELVMSGKLSPAHKYFDAINFYLKRQGDDWAKILIPDYVILAANEMAHFVVVLKDVLNATYKGKPIMALIRPERIRALYPEAMIVSHYLRRGYRVNWLSIFEKDPPDFIVWDVANDIKVDFEIKTKADIGNKKSMFKSMSKGLQSLKVRKNPNDRAVVVIFNDADLDWEKWLTNLEIQNKLHSRFANKEYKILSGVIFAGGDIIDESVRGHKNIGTRFVGYRSEVANALLPPDFLTMTKGI